MLLVVVGASGVASWGVAVDSAWLGMKIVPLNRSGESTITPGRLVLIPLGLCLCQWCRCCARNYFIFWCFFLLSCGSWGTVTTIKCTGMIVEVLVGLIIGRGSLKDGDGAGG